MLFRSRTDKEGNFVIGYTREQEHPVCLNLDKFVQRSAGVFGATGTGKSFLTRLMLAGLIPPHSLICSHASRAKLSFRGACVTWPVLLPSAQEPRYGPNADQCG